MLGGGGLDAAGAGEATIGKNLLAARELARAQAAAARFGRCRCASDWSKARGSDPCARLPPIWRCRALPPPITLWPLSARSSAFRPPALRFFGPPPRSLSASPCWRQCGAGGSICLRSCLRTCTWSTAFSTVYRFQHPDFALVVVLTQVLGNLGLAVRQSPRPYSSLAKSPAPCRKPPRRCAHSPTF
jgi:hypothetical protein